MTQPFINVGILSGTTIRFRLNGEFEIEQTRERIRVGEYVAQYENAHTILFQGKQYDALSFIPQDHSSFDLQEVVIGVQFHWERTETQVFSGELKLIADDKQLIAINRLPIEDYLLSVISSEMRATSSPELLKAHAIISRSWLLAQLEKSRNVEMRQERESFQTEQIGEEIHIFRWYDREDHELFDVCADDHCQRYQGISRICSEQVREAIQSTSGQVLMYKDQICDARFSKCCGGMTEEYESCWEPVHFDYLQAVPCSEESQDVSSWEDWIRRSPAAFCHTQDKKVLSQVLNDYDRETNDFYRWKVVYEQEELAALIRKKTNCDLGAIVDILPIERGKSGRIIRLRIVGTKQTAVIGKELEIRKTLSESHLYSSAFVVDKQMPEKGEIPVRFTLIGAGWGHGVGLCQIGAAMMAEKGFDYTEILRHYFRESELRKIFDS